MLDIDKELKALSQNKISPDKVLREKTRELVRQEYRRSQSGASQASAKPARHVVRWAAVVAAAAAVMLAVVMTLSPAKTAEAAGYYTVDINPSVSLSVDANDIVLSAKAGNSDAGQLLTGLSLGGLSIEDALDTIVRAASKGGWLKSDGHVLVAHFGSAPGLTEQQASKIVSDAAGNTVHVMVLQSSRNDYENAEKEHKNAGIELLRKNAGSLGINTDADTDTIIREMRTRQGKPTDTPAPNESAEHTPQATPKNNDKGNSTGQGNSNSNNNNNSNSSSNTHSPNHTYTAKTSDKAEKPENTQKGAEATPRPTNVKSQESHKPAATKAPSIPKDNKNKQDQ